MHPTPNRLDRDFFPVELLERMSGKAGAVAQPQPIPRRMPDSTAPNVT
jgi:hypothetical protein